jgi:hypothetical protein
LGKRANLAAARSADSHFQDGVAPFCAMTNDQLIPPPKQVEIFERDEDDDR